MTKIERQPVKSSLISEIGYDAPTQQMDVRFKTSGGVYRYANVSGELHAQIISAPSIGHAINQTLKKDPQRFPFRRLEPQEQ